MKRYQVEISHFSNSHQCIGDTVIKFKNQIDAENWIRDNGYVDSGEHFLLDGIRSIWIKEFFSGYSKAYVIEYNLEELIGAQA